MFIGFLVDINYYTLYHNLTILQHFDIYANWCNHFAHTNDYFKYLLKDLNCMGKKMFMMQ